MTQITAVRADVEARLANAIAVDPEFANRLIANPHHALKELLGVDVPESINITIHEESLTDVHLTIPARELTEAALEAVAGGAQTEEEKYVNVMATGKTDPFNRYGGN